MSNAQEHWQTSWQQLADEWSSAHEGWNDNTSSYFAAHFWSTLESEARAYRQALETLIEALDAVEHLGDQ